MIEHGGTFKEFLRHQAAGAAVLLFATVAAVAVANGPFPRPAARSCTPTSV